MRQALVFIVRIRIFIILAILVVTLLLDFFVVESHALEVKGTLTKKGLQVSDCRLSEITVTYAFGVLLGEPTIDGTYQWQAGSGTAEDCLAANTTIYIKVGNSVGQTGYIPISPTVPKSGAGYGFNTKGSPAWGSLIIKDHPKSGRYFSSEEAKDFWKSGFSATSFEILGSSRNKAAGEMADKKEQQDKTTCKPGWQMRTKVGYERYRCSNCQIVEMKVEKNAYNQTTYNGSIYVDQVISSLCSNQQDKFWSDNKESELEKYLQKKEWEKIVKKAQGLGAIKVAQKTVILKAWDSGEEDGDKVQIMLNDKKIKSSLRLYKQPSEMTLALVKGINRVKIKALNQGASGKNTAAFTITENGKVILSENWKLTTYEEAVLTIFSEQ